MSVEAQPGMGEAGRWFSGMSDGLIDGWMHSADCHSSVMCMVTISMDVALMQSHRVQR